MTPETERPDPSRVSELSEPPEPPKRQVPGIPVGPPRQDADVDQEAHEALQMKVAMKMVGSAMVFIGFIQVFMSASTGAEISIFPMILYFSGLALWAYSSVRIPVVRYAVIAFSLFCIVAFINIGEVLFWHKYVIYWGTIAMVVYFMFQNPMKPSKPS